MRQPPSVEITRLPAEFTSPKPSATSIEPSKLKVSPSEFTMSKPTSPSTFRPSVLAGGRGGLGVIGLVGGGIVALFRALFGRRKEQ
jgi:hypothetical protein